MSSINFSENQGMNTVGSFDGSDIVYSFTSQRIGGPRVFIKYATQLAYVSINIGSWLILGSFEMI